MMKKIYLDLTPNPALFEDIGQGNLAVHEAIGELVANCFDQRPSSPDPTIKLAVNVEVDFSKEAVSVVDNCLGITEEWLPDALTIAEKRAARGAEEKGMFGWGMKASASTIGFKIEIFSRPQGKDYELYFSLPIRELSSGKIGWTDLAAEVHPGTLENSPLGERIHGTAIVVSDLRRGAVDKQALENHLRHAYSPHLRDGDAILVNGVLMEPWEPVVFDTMKHELAVTLDEAKGHKVSGWVGVGKTQSQGDYGLNIYRKKQLIEAWNKDAFSSKHQMTSRVVGEIHADFVPTNFNKKGFEKESPEWKALVRYLKGELEPFLAASRRLGRDKNVDMDTKKTEAAATLAKQLQRVSGWTVSESGGWVGGEPAAAPPTTKKQGGGTEADKISTANFPNSFQLEGGASVEVSCQLSPLGAENEHWSYVAGNNKLAVYLNTDSPVIAKFTGEALAVIEAIATADAIESFLVTQKNFGKPEANRIRTQFITKALTG
jgi:hypothetical protein